MVWTLAPSEILGFVPSLPQVQAYADKCAALQQEATPQRKYVADHFRLWLSWFTQIVPLENMSSVLLRPHSEFILLVTSLRACFTLSVTDRRVLSTWIWAVCCLENLGPGPEGTARKTCDPLRPSLRPAHSNRSAEWQTTDHASCSNANKHVFGPGRRRLRNTRLTSILQKAFRVGTAELLGTHRASASSSVTPATPW